LRNKLRESIGDYKQIFEFTSSKICWESWKELVVNSYALTMFVKNEAFENEEKEKIKFLAYIRLLVEDLQNHFQKENKNKKKKKNSENPLNIFLKNNNLSHLEPFLVNCRIDYETLMKMQEMDFNLMYFESISDKVNLRDAVLGKKK